MRHHHHADGPTVRHVRARTRYARRRNARVRRARRERASESPWWRGRSRRGVVYGGGGGRRTEGGAVEPRPGGTRVTGRWAVSLRPRSTNDARSTRWGISDGASLSHTHTHAHVHRPTRPKRRRDSSSQQHRRRSRPRVRNSSRVLTVSPSGRSTPVRHTPRNLPVYTRADINYNKTHL